MEVIVISILAWSVVMSFLLWFCPKERIPLITEFFVKVWPKLPLSAMISAWKEKRQNH